MSLAAQVRAAVQTVAGLIGGPGGLLCDVVHEPWAGTFDGDGKPHYALPVTRQAFVWTYEAMSRRVKVVRTTGEESVDGPEILFLENVPVTTNDRFTLPDGSQPPITSVLGVTDPAGGSYFTQIRCGRPERGAIT